MADKEASLIIRLKDQASAGLEKFKVTLGGLKTALFATTSAVAAFIAAGISAIQAYAEQEAAVSKLENALKNQGLAVQKTSQDYQAFASALQKTTTFSDESIIETEALLTTFGLAGDTLKKTTVAALDLSKGLGTDLKTATLLLGKAAQGETGTLSRLGLTIADNLNPTEKFAAALDQVQRRWGGSAQAALQTTTGKLENFRNRVNDLQESLGGLLIPVFNVVLQYMEFLTSKLEIVSDAVKETGSAWAVFKMAALEALKSLLDGIGQVLEPIGLLFGSFGDNVKNAILKANAAIDTHIAKINQMAVNSKNAITSTVQQEKIQLDTQIKNRQATAQELNKVDDDLQKMYDERRKERSDWRIDEDKRIQDSNKLRAKDFEATLTFISSLSSAKNKELAAIGKAAGIASATIDTYAAANKALASAPPPFNFALAAAVIAAGVANVSKIAGVQLAEGGIVMPQRGGIQATIGEGGSPEAVIPLDDDRAKALLGGNTIIIQAGAFVGDRVALREFMKMIDRELFALQRNGMSVR